jgi:hypothetical protein
VAWFTGWVNGGKNLEEIFARLYVMIDELFPPDSFLDAYEAIWPEFEQLLGNSFDLTAAAKAPSLFGKENYWRKAQVERVRFLTGHRERVLNHWRTGGEEAGAARDSFANVEAALRSLSQQVLRNPDADDHEVVSLAQDVVFTSATKNAAMMAKYSVADVREWAREAISLELVPEARRRAGTSDAGRTLMALEARAGAENMSDEEHAVARDELLNVIFKS